MTPLDSAPQSDHVAGSRFALGNKGGPGNPFNRRVAELKRIFLEAVTDDDMRAVAHDIILKARGGDLAAARLMLQYSLGKPNAAVEPDRVEIDEHQLRLESSIPITAIQPGLGELPAETINGLANIIWPTYHSETLKPLIDGIDAIDAAAPGEARRAARKAARRARRLREKGIAPSANGLNGRDLDEVLEGLGKRARDEFGPSWVG